MSHIATPIFALNPLDKLDQLRETIDVSSPDPSAQFLLICEGKLVVRISDQSTSFTSEELSDIDHDKEVALFLGGKGERHYYALSVSMELEGSEYELVDYRAVVFKKLIQKENLGIIAQAGGVMTWHETHGFCSNCGTQTVVSHGGWRRDCPGCGKEHFPRLDPVIIMLVTHGDNCLIGASHHYPERLYSCLAGFMEPGETIEGAARRELYEESGVIGGRVEYICSQPWPFPHSIMIGVHVQAESTELVMDEKELRGLMWVSKDEVRDVLDNPEGKEFFLPPRLAIARTLIDHWLK